MSAPSDYWAEIDALTATLITCDGKGKEEKIRALNRLIVLHLKGHLAVTQTPKRLIDAKLAVAEIRDELERWDRIRMTPQQATELFGLETALHNEIMENGLDTCSREMCHAVLARKLVGRDWPIGADGDEVGERFFADLRVALDQRGIKHSF